MNQRLACETEPFSIMIHLHHRNIVLLIDLIFNDIGVEDFCLSYKSSATHDHFPVGQSPLLWTRISSTATMSVPKLLMARLSGRGPLFLVRLRDLAADTSLN